MKLTKAQDKRLRKVQDKLVDEVDRLFPKIKPQGVNKGRGEAGVLVGIALFEFKQHLADELARQKKELIEKLEKIANDGWTY